jgi:hypothetical protein
MPDQAPPDAPPEPPPKRRLWPWLLLVAGLAVMVGAAVIGIPWVRGVREDARRDNCVSNIGLLGIACHLYADDNDENFPENWQQLYPNYADSLRLFSCPSRPCVFVRDFVSGTATERSSSYILLPGRWPALPGNFFLTYEKFGNHHQGFHVVYVNAHDEWWPVSRKAEFQRELADQEAQLPELRKQWEQRKKAQQSQPLPAKPAGSTGP